ncbi:MAG: hypothetical protein WAW37_05875 [Syntrophobacteraceae bacterium]
MVPFISPPIEDDPTVREFGHDMLEVLMEHDFVEYLSKLAEQKCMLLDLPIAAAGEEN